MFVAMKNSIKSIENFKAAIKQARKFRLQNGRPFLTISYAQSVDGSISKINKEQMPLSGPESMLR